MPAKTGGSHSFAAFTSMIVGTVISRYIWEMLPPFAHLSETVGALLLDVTGVSYSAEFVGGLLIASVLAFAWGVLYHLKRH
jgi:hypothetical protein